MAGEWHNPIEKIYLTLQADHSEEKTKFSFHCKEEKQLKHPNWEMGAKITTIQQRCDKGWR